jgi:hypothetical protein
MGVWFVGEVTFTSPPRPVSVTAIASAHGTVLSPVQKDALAKTRVPPVGAEEGWCGASTLSLPYPSGHPMSGAYTRSLLNST